VRIALISDIHGNAIALDAVLADCESVGVEQFWFVGDHVALGPSPDAVLRRVTAIPHAVFVRGNTDRYVVTGEGPPPSLGMVRADPALIPIFAAIAASFAWTRGFAVATGWFDWLAALPLEHRYVAPNGVRILAVHAAPGDDDGEGIHPGRSNNDIARLVAESDADLLFVGHTHEAMVRQVGRTLVVNLGCVSNPRGPDRRASYVVLEVDESEVSFTHRRVAYDHEAFARAVESSRHPAAGFIMSHQHGEQHERRPHADHVALHLGKATRLSATTIARAPGFGIAH
jgi:putative phosphoesterase